MNIVINLNMVTSYKLKCNYLKIINMQLVVNLKILNMQLMVNMNIKACVFL